MDRSLDSLDVTFKPLAIQLLARLVEAGIPVMILNTLRTQAEQDEALAKGNSRVKRSRHQDGFAIDVCPYSTYDLHGADKPNWDTNDPVWFKIGQVGESLGLRWGGRFGQTDPKKVGWDPGHFEIPSKG
jgi:hypothetical protein